MRSFRYPNLDCHRVKSRGSHNTLRELLRGGGFLDLASLRSGMTANLGDQCGQINAACKKAVNFFGPNFGPIAFVDAILLNA